MSDIVFVLNGPNLNLLGTREPEIYGYETLDEIHAGLALRATELGLDIDFFQSNWEGALIDRLHVRDFDVVVLNAGGLTHTSVALHDCIKAMPFPVVEVHMSNIHAREPFRHHSAIAPACVGSVAGFGWRSYGAALRLLVEQLGEQAANA